MTHTPTPWKAYTQKGGWNIHGPDCMIAQVLFDPVLLEETCKTHRANARHIVKCVNTHEELVSALKGMIELMDNKPTSYDEDQQISSYRAILSNAEKGTQL